MTKNPWNTIRKCSQRPIHRSPIAEKGPPLAEASTSKASFMIGTTDTIRDYWLMERLQRFSAVWPTVALETFTAEEPFLTKHLLEGRYDVAVLFGSSTWPSTGFTGRLCADDGLQLVQAISPNESVPTLYDVLLWSDHASYSRLATQQLIEHGPPALTVELPTDEAVKQAVLHGFGAALLPNMMVDHELRTGNLQAFPAPASISSVQLWACWPQKQRLSPHLDQLIQYLGSF